jgi:hypothetical protein
VQAGAVCIALNPGVTQDTIAETVCVPGYTARVRPTQRHVMDVKQTLSAGLALETGAEIVLDHIVPLALGGHPSDPSNLQLQELRESHRKDRIEVKLQCLVCTGQVSLDEARSAIAADWAAAYHKFALAKCHRNREVPRSVAPSESDQAAPTGCLIKGNINHGDRIYHVPGGRYYAMVKMDLTKGKRWFCSESAAEAAGWRPAP